MVTAYVPFQVKVRASGPALLETPRMYLPGYRASVDGSPVGVTRSEDGLVVVPVPPGTHVVTVWLSPPTPLIVSYWLAGAAWAAILLLTALRGVRSLREAGS
jgi:hypothetical protein